MMPRVRLIFAWYDCWVGFFWNRDKRCLYIFPFPMLGVVFEFRGPSIGAGNCAE